VNRLLYDFAGAALGYFAGRLADELFDLEALAREIARRVRMAFPWLPRYGGEPTA